MLTRQGADALGLFRKMLTGMPDKMEDVMDPKRFSKKMQQYADTDDIKLQGLYKQVELGNFTAFKELQQAIADKEWDGCKSLILWHALPEAASTYVHLESWQKCSC